MVIGFHVIWAVTPALHTPLMSVTNAISGVIVIGGMLEFGGELSDAHFMLGTVYTLSFVLISLVCLVRRSCCSLCCACGQVALSVAFVNVVGGFLITHRMLAMFHK